MAQQMLRGGVMASSPRSHERRGHQGGFTLVELMVVVSIIAVLAVLATVGYQRIIKASHISEATEMVNAIKLAQEQFHAEAGSYSNISASLDPGDLYPAAIPGKFKTAWGGTCATCADTSAWKRLPVHASGPLLYGYATMAGAQGAALPASPVTGMTFPAATDLTSDWFVVVARGDQDGNGIFATVVGVSWQRDLYIDKDDE